MNLSPTAKVVLGMIALGERTGYDIKRTVEKSTAFFWGASYGQIYPELERLERAGLVKGKAVTGGRARARVHRHGQGAARSRRVALRRRVRSRSTRATRDC